MHSSDAQDQLGNGIREILIERRWEVGGLSSEAINLKSTLYIINFHKHLQFVNI